MSTVAIICEYNPFHYGHKYQLDVLHELGYNVISIMSGNTVQRGELALFEKYSRAKTAVHNGADVVVELPLPYSMTSAVDFARSGVSVARSLGVDALAFGCESPELVFELAENLRDLGMDVTIVQRPKQLMNPFDADMASFIHAEMCKHGVKLALGYSVEGFAELMNDTAGHGEC